MRRAAWWWSVTVFVGAAALADYRQVYVDAQRAERDGRLEAAAAGYEAAARERSQETARARLVGAIPEPYLPLHRLGVVYFELGRCREALAAFERSARQGVSVALAAAAAEGETRRRECRAWIAADDALEAARAQLARAREAGTGAGELLQLETSIAHAAQGLEEAHERREVGATAGIVDGLTLATRRLEALAPAPPPSGPEGASVTAPRESAARSESPASPAGADSPPLPTPATGEAPAPETATPSALPPGLRAAVDAYFAGSYATAVELADRHLPAAPAGGAGEFVGRLVRGAGRYALYLLDAERDTALRLAAAEDLRAAHRLRRRFRPQTAHFSPRLVAFFDELAAPAGAGR